MSGRLALVTGASAGIGAATVRRLTLAGCRVAFTYHLQREPAEALAEETGARAYPLDLREKAEITGLAEAVTRDLGTVEILVHNAGLLRDNLLPFLSEEDWDAVLDVNLKGVYRLTKALIKGMLAQRWGRVIAIASNSAVGGHPGQTNYSAAKGGLIAFTKALAREVASYGVTANAISPGYIDTPMLAGLSERKLEDYVASIPLRRLGRPEEVAELVAYLASEPAGYVTGQTVRIDGGLVMA